MACANRRQGSDNSPLTVPGRTASHAGATSRLVVAGATTSRQGGPQTRVFRPARWSAEPGQRAQPLDFRASMSLGNTLWTSPTMPRSATEKIGASASLLMATMFFEFFIPTRC